MATDQQAKLKTLVREKIAESGMSAKEVAQKARLSASTLYNWFNGSDEIGELAIGKLSPPATFTPKPAPIAAPSPTAVTMPSGPVYTQEGPSRRRVDPAWWPCNQGQVKGNRNSGIYHAPGMRDYAYTFLNVACFNTEADAQGAGFRRAQR